IGCVGIFPDGSVDCAGRAADADRIHFSDDQHIYPAFVDRANQTRHVSGSARIYGSDVARPATGGISKSPQRRSIPSYYRTHNNGIPAQPTAAPVLNAANCQKSMVTISSKAPAVRLQLPIKSKCREF